MQVSCSCGSEFSYRDAPCPDAREGCCVTHYDMNSFICPKCGRDSGPSIMEAFQTGNVRFEIGMGVFNIGGLKKLELSSDTDDT